jgi:hypothetical protein
VHLYHFFNSSSQPSEAGGVFLALELRMGESATLHDDLEAKGFISGPLRSHCH